MAEYIEREAAKQAVVKAVGARHSPFNAIVMLPAADVRPVVRGKWTRGDMPTYGGYKCSACGGNTVHYKANFCPNCGADMREES